MDYAKTISRLADAEKLFGKINSPILHLRILAQNKLFQQTGEQELGFELKKNCATFLKDYAEIEALEEKFKEVYRISENLSEVPSNLEEVKLFKEKKDKVYQDGRKKYIDVIEKYIESIGGKNRLNNVKSIEKIVQADPIGYLEMLGQKIKLNVARHTLRIKDKERAYYEIKGQGFPTTTYIATPGKVIWEAGRGIMSTDEVLIKKWNDKLNIFPELIPLSEKDSVYYEEIIEQGNKVYLLTKKDESSITKMVFDATTGLKISETSKSYFSKTIFEESDYQIKSYKEFDGIKFPDLIVEKFIHTSSMNQSDKQIFEVSNRIKLLNNQGPGVRSLSVSPNTSGASQDTLKLKKEIHSYNTKIISIKINPEFRNKDLE
ncbi:MAG TPA: hypothetical protein PLJ41_13360 [Sediminibacterium sp.]|uniref:hypothetical protein n=2 Tax=Sediminibacterium sp. TaxID=1917865 RepID=UPI002CBB9FBD|nr:hypothetical protein [Sediminibacterium sp.]HQS25425.1 hypothetical protein [Sediminibacterium sp.]